MIAAKIITFIGLVIVLKSASATPDSAGIVEMVNGLAYGGIPYGSVTGMLARNSNGPGASSSQYYPRNRNPSSYTSRIIVTPNYRAAGVAARQQGPVQIYNLPGVVAPGIVGRISQIGF